MKISTTELVTLDSSCTQKREVNFGGLQYICSIVDSYINL